MGLYINPEGKVQKEEWLLKEARASTAIEVKEFEYTPMAKELPLILIDSGYFTALGILYDSRERTEFMEGLESGRDTRPHSFWFADVDKLKKIYPHELDIYIGNKK